jgi:PAS domain S-box-containing protein/putative nucleotidyltransferase with HDIG domain
MLENSLCQHDSSGKIVEDSKGNPVLECMCGNIIRGYINPDKPFFSIGGSFWTNSTSELLASTSEEERQGRTCNRCNGEGYESVALIPLKTREGNIGLLQMNDASPGRFTPDLIMFYEDIAQSIGVILAKKDAEDQLIRREHKYRTLFENTKDAILITSRQGKYIDVNRAAIELLGYSREEFGMLNVKEMYFKPGLRNKILDKVEKKGYIKDFEIQFKKKSGEVINCMLTTSIYHDDSGRFIGYQSIVRDVTERKQQERELKLNEARQNSLVKILQYDARTIQEFLDFALNEAIKITESEIGYVCFYDDDEKKFTLNSWSRNVMKECTIQDPQTVYQLEKTGIWGEAVRQAKPVILNDFQMERPLKKGYPKGYAALHKYLTVPVFSKGKIVAVVGVANRDDDYTNSEVMQLQLLMDAVWKAVESRQSEEQVKMSQLLLRTVIDSSPDHILVKDRERKYILVNKALANVLSIEPEEMIGKPDTEFFINYKIEDGLKEEIGGIHEQEDQAFTGIVTHNLYHVYNRENGDRKVLDSIRMPLRDNEDKIYGVVSYIRDVTEMHKITEELRKSNERMKKLLSETVEAIASMCETRDPYTAGHQKRVTRLACAIAREMGLSPERIADIEIGGVLHDLGKMYIPAEILSKPGKLNEMEFTLIRQHPQVGYDIVSKIEFPCTVSKMVYEHHERLDGSGYPRQLQEKDITIEAKILAVADVVEAMSSHRPYRPSLGIEQALEEITRNRGKLYDSRIVDICLALFKEKQFSFDAEPGA